MTVPESEQDKALADLYRRMDAKGWPRYDENAELCMERAREFLDCAALIYPRP